MQEKIWKATMYLRLSKEDSGHKQESSSIQNQRELINDFVSKNKNIEIVNMRIDDGYTGTNFDRPAFNSMMDDIRDKLVDCVIVKDLSRFGRDHLQAGNYIQNVFPILNVRFIAIIDNIDTLNFQQSDNLIIPIKNYINSAYSREISKKVSTSLVNRRDNGLVVAPFVAFGYIKSPENKNIIVIDKKISSVIKDIFNYKLLGWSSQKIADYLNNNGYLSPSEYKKNVGISCSTGFKTKSQSIWYATTIIRILSNPIYIGTLEQGKSSKTNFKFKDYTPKPKEDWSIVENNHEPIIEKSVFDSVQRLLLLDTRKPPNKDDCHIFSGMLFCDLCKSNLKRQSIKSKDKTYVYYSCPKCKGLRIKEELLIDTVEKSIKLSINQRIIASELFLQTDISNYNNIRIAKLNQNIHMLEDNLNDIRRYSQGLYDSYLQKQISQDDYNTFSDEYKLDEEKIIASINLIKEEIDIINTSNSNSNLWVDEFKKNENITKIDRKIVSQLIDKISINGKNSIIINFAYQSEYSKILDYISVYHKKAYASRLLKTEVYYG